MVAGALVPPYVDGHAHYDMHFDEPSSAPAALACLPAALVHPSDPTPATVQSLPEKTTPPSSDRRSLKRALPLDSQPPGPENQLTTPSDSVSPDRDQDEGEMRAIKRQRNTMAARRYRQKRLDQIAELEQALLDMRRERDDLKVQLAAQRAENRILRQVMKKDEKE